MMRILLVEDNPGDARLLREALRDIPAFNFELHHVTTLGRAIDTLATHVMRWSGSACSSNCATCR
jgi:CheY-like chemotaxis protein